MSARTRLEDTGAVGSGPPRTSSSPFLGWGGWPWIAVVLVVAAAVLVWVMPR